MVIVPLYDTLGSEAITYIVNKGTAVLRGLPAQLLGRFSDFTVTHVISSVSVGLLPGSPQAPSSLGAQVLYVIAW